MKQDGNIAISPADDKTRLDYIDGLRGVAAAIVVISHVLEVIAKDFHRFPLARVIDHPLLDYVGLGRAGVVAFFCVSGFVVPFSLTPRGGIKRFVLTRAFRLYPAYWLSIALAVITGIAVGESHPNPAMIAINLTMAQAALGQPDIISVYWTLFYELLFYGACATLFVLGLMESTIIISAITLLFIFMAILSSAARYFLDLGIPVGIPLYMSIMFLGTLYRHAVLHNDPVARYTWLPIFIVIALAVPFICLMSLAHGPVPDRPWSDIIAVYLGFGLFFLTFRFRKLFSQPAMLWLGAVSYSLYLFHPLVVDGTRALLRLSSIPEISLVILLCSIPISLVVARLVWIFVERPAIRFGHRIGQSLHSQPL